MPTGVLLPRHVRTRGHPRHMAGSVCDRSPRVQVPMRRRTADLARDERQRPRAKGDRRRPALWWGIAESARRNCQEQASRLACISVFECSAKSPSHGMGFDRDAMNVIAAVPAWRSLGV